MKQSAYTDRPWSDAPIEAISSGVCGFHGFEKQWLDPSIGQMETTNKELLELQQTLYASKNPTRFDAFQCVFFAARHELCCKR